jgi:outer membrane lipoprotein LolB
LVVGPQALQAEADRQDWLLARDNWAFQGRVAISQGSHGGSGRIDWQQTGRDYRVQLSAPVTRQSWRLSGEGATGRALLEGVDGGPRAGDDPQQLLRDATGWNIPVEGLPAWVRGLVDAGAPGVTLDAQGRPGALEQEGWRVDYLDWFPPAQDRPALPRRIEARKGEAKVRLIVDSWDFPSP